MLKLHFLPIFICCLTFSAYSQTVFVNEINYMGSPTNEGIGFAGPAGTDIQDWSLIFYHSDGTINYEISPLAPGQIIIPDDGDGFGEVWYDVVQVNQPSAFAVINSTGQLVQFLSYGVVNSANYQVSAVEGIATQTASSTWVGEAVNEQSLQLIGTGIDYNDFLWLLPAGSGVSIGSINTGQMFSTSLPIQLISFDVEALKNGHQLTWSTSSEANNDHFIIERSIDGFHFENIKTMNGQNNSNQKTNYQYLDKSTGLTAFYYRLRQVDKNGAVQFSQTLFSSRHDASVQVQTFPNPTTDELHVSIANIKNTNSIINIVNTEGKVVKSIALETTQPLIKVDVQTLPIGRYFLQIKQEQRVFLGSFVKH